MTVQFLNTNTSTAFQTERIFDAEILNNISVKAPYFALKNLRINQEYVYSDFTTEVINTEEEGPIGAAEVGRHMAILGSVVLSKENPKKERHYYLATDANIKRHGTRHTGKHNLSACAKLEFINRKKGLISGMIFDIEGNIIFEVDVTYMVLGYAIFERMFAEYNIPTPSVYDFNPYENDVVLQDLKLDVKSCFATIGIVKPEDCPGHFHDYPALPVARMGAAMGKIGGLHFMHLNPSDKNKYTICSAELHAKQLVFTGDVVNFKTEIVDPNPDKGMIIKVTAFNDKINSIAESILHFHY